MDKKYKTDYQSHFTVVDYIKTIGMFWYHHINEIIQHIQNC